VAIIMPVALGFGRSKDIPASRLLMPVSYCSILGGCCTLIGTSTNLLVNGTLRQLGEPVMSMFQLAPIGVPLLLVAVGYLVIFGPKLIPARSSISGTLDIESRITPLFHLLIGAQSPLVGQRLTDTLLGTRDAGVFILEVRRGGARLMLPLSQITIQSNDRFLVAMHRRGGGRSSKPDALIAETGAHLIATVEGIVSELVLHDESSLVGETLAHSDFRQRHRAVVLAVHRGSRNITDKIGSLPLASGDTLLVITARTNLANLQASRDFVMTDVPDRDEPETSVPVHRPAHHIGLAWGAMLAVVLVTTLTGQGLIPGLPAIPIHFSALVGALLLCWSRVITPRDAYQSIDWQVLIMLYGLLGLGMAMVESGTDKWLAQTVLEVARQLVSPQHLPYLSLWLMFLLTLLLTEILSNNATAVMMVPVVVSMAKEMAVSPWPFVMGITVAASAAFALPMGYQTHMMIFGPGGYRFSDFLRVGIPLNIICWVVSCLIIPLVWPFH
nr:SLC13 family permease [Akkermansiaceae bacterium]